MTPNTIDRSFQIEGYAAIFGVPDMSGDVIRPGAFSGLQSDGQKLIPGRGSRVMMLYQHAADRPVGCWHRMEEDQFGLYVRGTVFAETDTGEDLFALLKGGAIDGLSIGFSPIRSRRNRDGRRELTSIDLWEVSIVTFPMAPQARIQRMSGLGERLPRNLLKN